MDESLVETDKTISNVTEFEESIVVGNVTAGELQQGNSMFTFTGENIFPDASYSITVGWCCTNGTGRVDIYQVEISEADPDTASPLKSTLVYTFMGLYNFSHQATFALV